MKNDIDLGLSKFKTIKEIVDQLKSAHMKTDQSLPPVKLPEEFVANYPLPAETPSSEQESYVRNGRSFYRIRTLLYKLSEDQHARALKRGDKDAKLYHSPRTELTMLTPFHMPQYSQITPFVEVMYKRAEEKQSKWLAQNPKDTSYSLLYSDESAKFSALAMTKVFQQNSTYVNSGERLIEHGLPLPPLTWPRIEELGEKIFSMDTRNIVQDKKQCHQFYDSAIEFIWLMGNTTPMRRGTGCYVEQFLALFHAYHDLPLPIIKRGFQLDCLNLTFDLESYKKLFLSFFEPPSLHPSVAEYHQQQYKNNPKMQETFKTFNIAPPQPLSESSQFFCVKPAVPIAQTLAKDLAGIFHGSPSPGGTKPGKRKAEARPDSSDPKRVSCRHD